MGKQELRQRETNVATKEGVGKQLEQTFTVDDSALPSPQELEAGSGAGPSKMKKIEELQANGSSIRLIYEPEFLEILEKYNIK